MALCADAEIRDGGLVGDPTEGALVVLAAKGGVDPTLTRERYPRVATLPFDAAYKFMATFHRMEDADGQGGHPRLRQGRPRPAPGARLDGPRPGRQELPGGRGQGPVPGRERASRRAGPAGPGHRPAGLRPGHLRPERGPAPGRGRPRAPRARRHRRPAALRGARRHRQGALGRHPGPDDHRRPRGHRRGHRPPARDRGPGDHRRRVLGDVRRPGRRRHRRHRRHRPGRAGGQGPARRDPPPQGPHRRDDGRRRERRAGAQDGRHRRGHGHHRDRGLQGGRGDDPDRRQLRDDRRAPSSRAAPCTTT